MLQNGIFLIAAQIDAIDFLYIFYRILSESTFISELHDNFLVMKIHQES